MVIKKRRVRNFYCPQRSLSFCNNHTLWILVSAVFGEFVENLNLPDVITLVKESHSVL